jgi:hypothetical protein
MHPLFDYSPEKVMKTRSAEQAVIVPELLLSAASRRPKKTRYRHRLTQINTDKK